MEFSFVFDRKKKCKVKDDLGVIELRAYHSGQVKYCSTKIFIRKTEWNTGSGERITNKNKDYELLNFKLDDLLSKIKKEYFLKSSREMVFNLDDVAAFMKVRRNKSSSYIDFVTAELEGDLLLSQKTKIQHKNTLLKLKEFANKDVLFSDLTIDYLEKFFNFLRNKGYKANTVHKHHKNIKKFIETAIRKEYTDIKNPCKHIVTKTEHRSLQVLKMEEIDKLRSLSFEAYECKVKQARDMFLFACYTGLRISDVCALKSEYIKTEERGLQLDFYTKKVNKHAVLPLYLLFPESTSLSRPEQILEEYRVQDSEFLFPKLSEQFINRNLKVIAHRAGIKFNLTFHIARETFATIAAKKLQAPVVKQLLQHSDIRTTQLYFHFNDKMVRDSLEKVSDWTT